MKEAGCSRNSPCSFQCYRVLIICGNGFLPLYANNKNVTNNLYLRIAYVQSYTIIKRTKLISQAFRRSRLLILMFLIRKCYDNVERFLQIAGFPFWEPSFKQIFAYNLFIYKNLWIKNSQCEWFQTSGF